MARPWQSRQVLDLLDAILKDRVMKVLEFGSGYSTPWLEKRAGRLVSVEHDIRWYDKIKPLLHSTEYILSHPEQYISQIERYGKGYFDIVIVDGLKREECIRKATPYIKEGGYMILDDSEKEKYATIKEEMEKYLMKTIKDHESETTVWKIDVQLK